MAGQLWTLDTSLPMSPMTVCCREAPKRSPACSLHKHTTQVPLTAAIDLLVRLPFPQRVWIPPVASTHTCVVTTAAVCPGHGRELPSSALPAADGHDGQQTWLAHEWSPWYTCLRSHPRTGPCSG